MASTATSISDPNVPTPATDKMSQSSTHSSTKGLPSPSIAIGMHLDNGPAELRPSLAGHVPEPSDPSSGYKSPLRHHRRTPSAHREVKETLNAKTEYSEDDEDGRTHHRINQYTIKEEIGRGSYGSVHLATDQYGQKYAVKEFSKTRLRKRAQSNILRRGPRRPQRFPPTAGLNPPFSPPLAHFSNDGSGEASDALFLIREEIAIMKKLNHPNLVSLIEVLDDPDEDSLYMVMEMCEKGVVMKVGLGQEATPYDEETCRYWFRDLILGIEYLHAQGVIHRDIKPDNLLLSGQDELKIVDFGVSEMFEKPDAMMTAKSAGSPAFLAPELCVARHGDVSGKAADIWAMGVCLYCLRYGKIPFEHDGVVEIYNAIRTQPHSLPEGENADFADLINRVLEKDPNKRIKMPELREHPWVTKGGEDPLLSAERNCQNLVEPPNDLEVNRAFTRKMNHLLCVMKAIQKFKAARARKPGRSANRVLDASGQPFNPSEEKAKAEEVEALIEQRRKFIKQRQSTDPGKPLISTHDSKTEEPLLLGIGPGADDPFSREQRTPDVVSDSPTAADFNVYERAYKEEVERITSRSKTQPKTYLTRFVKDHVLDHGEEHIIGPSDESSSTSGKFADVVSKITGR